MKKFLKIIIFFSLLILISCNSDSDGEPQPDKSLLFLQNLPNEKLDRSQKLNILDKAFHTASKMNEDSIKNSIFLEISYQYLKLEDSIAFFYTNKKARDLSIVLNDSSGIADTYWDAGDYFRSKNINDSAYYYYNHAQKIYEAIDNDFSSASLLLNMAIVQKNIKDYTGSEITTTQAISILKPLQKHTQLFSAYNNLGIIFNELEEYDRSIFYHQKALEHLEKTGDTSLIPLTLNNIGVVYDNKGQYELAIDNYKKAINYDSLYYEDPRLYAMLLDNLAFSRFHLGDTIGVLQQFKTALEIREELNINSGIIVNKLHMAEYYLGQQDTFSAINSASQAKELSIKTKNTRDLLSSLLILSNAEKDSAIIYTKEYIKINDSLQKEERAIRNKFARIRFETDEYISETEKLNQRVVRISLVAIGLILISILLYIIKDQWSRNKFIKQKQDANQEIYSLILAQQRNFEEGREIEKQHISRELHDGILGKLFGVRLSLDSLNEEDTPEVKKKRFQYIEEIQNIAEEIRLISHRLNNVSLIDVDFKTILEELIEKQNRGKIKFHLVVSKLIEWEYIEDNIKINIYRIVQEAISNIHRHSGATEAFVQVRKNENKLILEISDNGKGISTMQSSTGIGIKNMKFRAKNIGGDLEITQKNDPIQGSLIKLTVKL